MRAMSIMPDRYTGTDPTLADGLATPAEKNTLKPKNISPEDATATKQTAGKRMLFVEGK